MSSHLGRRLHLAMMVFWACNLVGVWFLPSPWVVFYVALVSIYANFVGHWSGWSAERPTEIEEEK